MNRKFLPPAPHWLAQSKRARLLYNCRSVPHTGLYWFVVWQLAMHLRNWGDVFAVGAGAPGGATVVVVVAAVIYRIYEI